MIQQIINKLSQYSNIAILGFGREGKTTYEFVVSWIYNALLAKKVK